MTAQFQIQIWIEDLCVRIFGRAFFVPVYAGGGFSAFISCQTAKKGTDPRDQQRA
jgi:hypothetical protein